LAPFSRRAIGPLLALAIFGLQAAAIHRQSLSGDGAQHLLAGQHALVHGQNLHNLEHPPLVKLVAALPVLASGEALWPPVLPREAVPATDRMHRHAARVWQATVSGRWIVLAAFGAPLLVACFFLGRRFGGPVAGWLLVAMVGLSFDLVPWLSSLQTDAAVACGFLVTLLAGLRWLERPSLGRAAAVGAGVGLAAASKFSGLLLLPIVLLLAVAPAPGPIGWRRRVALPLAAFSVAAALVLATYGVANRRYDPETGREVIRQYCRGEATLLPGDRLLRQEKRLLELERRHPLVAQWATGVLGIAAQDALGVYPSYAFGEVTSRGRWWYFPAVLLVKTPLVLLVAAAALAILWRPHRGGADNRGALFLVATALLYLAVAMRSNYNIGLRHLLPILPLLYLPLAVGLARRRRWAAAIAVLLLVEAAAVAPNWIAATNTWWLGERNPTRFALGAGDIEFRQNLRWLAAEARQRDLKDLGVLYFGLQEDVLRAYLPSARVVRPGDPLPPGWYVVNVAVEQLVPGILRGDPQRIYQYEERRAIALRWRRIWRRIRSGEDHGWVAGTFHLYRLPATPRPSVEAIEQRPILTDLVVAEVPRADLGVAVAVRHLIGVRIADAFGIDLRVVDGIVVQDLVHRVVEAGRLVEVELRRRDAGHQHEVVLVLRRIAHGSLDGEREVGDVARLDVEPLSPQVDLPLALEADRRLLGHVVGVPRALFTRLQGEDVHGLGQEAVARPGDLPSLSAASPRGAEASIPPRWP
jgi:4-amino-4-deoxy-L-arabinose transferase-like glycosyltransferase